MSGIKERENLLNVKRWVIKLGSNVLLDERGELDRVVFVSLVREVHALMSQGCEVTLVSSGAVALGRMHLRLERRPSDLDALQALAAVGQPLLMALYGEEFGRYGRAVAQVLFSRDDLNRRARYLNARRALRKLGDLGAVAIVNENDTVATEELRFGDNDRLAAMTCGVVSAEQLVILSDVDGVFDVEAGEGGERRFTERIEAIEAEDERLDEVAGPSRSGVGTGGMRSKVEAARVAARLGVSTLIAPGKRLGVLQALRRGESVGTLLWAKGGEGVTGRRVWLSAGARALGRVWCDEGAKRAIRERGASLLPIGVTGVEGAFQEGDVIECVGPDGERFALGVAVYDAAATARLMGAQAGEIVDRLGYRVLDCVLHRDNMIMGG